jgi:kynurenine formamidase
MPHWPDNPPIVMQRAMDIERGDGCNVSHLAMGVHSGTHIDGPVHFVHQAPVRAGPYEMICLPVKLHAGDGAPARAILRPLPDRPPGSATPGPRP